MCGAGAVRMRKTSSANILEVVRDRTRHRSVCIYVKSMHDVRGLIAIIHEIFTIGHFKIFVSASISSHLVHGHVARSPQKRPDWPLSFKITDNRDLPARSAF